MTLGPLQLGTPQPRPQGFSLKKWVKGKALETRLGTPRVPLGEGRGSKKERTLGTRLDGRSRVQIFYILSCYSQERMHITMCKKIPQPLWMQKILDVISPYLQPSTYFMQMSRVHSKKSSAYPEKSTLTRTGADLPLTRVGTRYYSVAIYQSTS